MLINAISVSFFKEQHNLWSVDEFIDAIASKLANQYNKKGYSCYKEKKVADAVKYYDMSINFNPEDAYPYYGKGIVHHTVAYENKDTELLKKAENNYLKALEIDPNHQGSLKELEKLRKTMEAMGIREARIFPGLDNKLYITYS